MMDRQRASGIGRGLATLEAAAEAAMMRKLRHLPGESQARAGHLPLIESALRAGQALLSRSHASLARAGRAAPPMSTVQP